jgi:hypothetical protein
MKSKTYEAPRCAILSVLLLLRLPLKSKHSLQQFALLFNLRRWNDVVKGETWSLTLREEHRLRVFENRILKGILGPKMDDVTGEWRKLQNEELHNLYLSSNIIRQIKLRRVR